MLDKCLIKVNICCWNYLALHVDGGHNKLRGLLRLLLGLLFFGFNLFLFDLYIIFFLLDFLDIFD